MKLSREQAEAFLATLWPCGHMSHLDNPTRTFLSALVGRVPDHLPHSRASDPDAAKIAEIASIFRALADHFDETGEEVAARHALSQAPSGQDGSRG